MVFHNHQIDVIGSAAIAMGTYDFTDATDGSVTTVEYTFGYKRNADGKVLGEGGEVRETIPNLGSRSLLYPARNRNNTIH